MKTQLFGQLIQEDEAFALFYHLRDSIQWEDGIKSKKGFTRLAKPLTPIEDEIITRLVKNTLLKINASNYYLEGIYLNYYENGNMDAYHSHLNTPINHFFGRIKNFKNR
jgi:hypothetical protein